MRAWLAVFAAVTFLAGAGCRTCHDRQEKKMAELGQALLRLSSAVEAVVRYDDLPPTADEKEILDAAAKDDPGLLVPFEGYSLHVQRQGAHSVVLVCERGDRRGLLEDAGCSAPLDRKLWATTSPAPCSFGLDTGAVCAPPARTPQAP